MRLFLFPTRLRRPLLAALIVIGAAGVRSDSLLSAPTVRAEDFVCATESAAALEAAQSVPRSLRLRVRRAIEGATALFRFNRSSEALPKLDAVLEMLAGPGDLRVAPARRERMTLAINALWSCIATRRAAPMAKLAVRTFRLDTTAPQGRGEPAGAGVYVRVEGIPAGRTASDGALTVQVPSGPVRVTALVPSWSIGEQTIALAPGGSGAVSIVLDDGKDVTEETDLVLSEAPDGIINATAASFTLKFVRDGILVPVTRVEAIELLDRDGHIEGELEDRFTVKEGAIVATDAASLYAEIAKRRGETTIFRVHAVDADRFTHSNKIELRIRQSDNRPVRRR